jgi:anti-anti-sigma regulatory factor
MLRITTKKAPGSLSLVLEGRLCGAWTQEADKAWSRLLASADGEPLFIDLAGVTFIDHAGESWLASVLGRGAKVRASGLLISHIVQEVERKLPG